MFDLAMAACPSQVSIVRAAALAISATNHVTPRTRTSAHLHLRGVGDEVAAAHLRTSAERLLACGIDELTVDLSSLDDGHPTFLHTLAALTATARAHSCELFVTGVRSPALLAALDEAPLDELFAIYEAACRHEANPITTAPTCLRPQRPLLDARAAAGAVPCPGSTVGHARPGTGARAGVTGTPLHARAETTSPP